MSKLLRSYRSRGVQLAHNYFIIIYNNNNNNNNNNNKKQDLQVAELSTEVPN